MYQIKWISPNIIRFKIVPCCISTKIPMMFLPHHPKFLNTIWRNMSAYSSNFSCISYTVSKWPPFNTVNRKKSTVRDQGCTVCQTSEVLFFGVNNWKESTMCIRALLWWGNQQHSYESSCCFFCTASCRWCKMVR